MKHKLNIEYIDLQDLQKITGGASVGIDHGCNGTNGKCNITVGCNMGNGKCTINSGCTEINGTCIESGCQDGQGICHLKPIGPEEPC